MQFVAVRLAWCLVPLLLVAAGTGGGEQSTQEEVEVVAIAEAALEAISREDMVAFTDLMADGAMTYSVRETAEGAVVQARSRAEQRAVAADADYVERGFAAEARVAGRIATVWLPYDFYLDGEWSHCGVDVFTLLRGEEGWKIVAVAWTVAQPPACEPHPAGPPLDR